MAAQELTNCLNCQKPLEKVGWQSVSRKRKYCSSECYQQFRTGKHRTTPMRECKQCGKKFLDRKYRKMFCSSECQHKARLPSEEYFNCVACGKKKRKTFSPGRANKYCSNKCYRATRFKDVDRSYQASKACRVCGEVFSKPIKNYSVKEWKQREYCSQQCRIIGLVRFSKKLSNTKLEKIVKYFLDASGVKYDFQVSIPQSRFVVDFIIPSEMVAIECDGHYWHSQPAAIERDLRKDTQLTSSGYKVVRLPEKSILSGEYISTLREELCLN